jgi:hypothetical protein
MPFDASTIPLFSAIRLPFQFTGDISATQKWFVVLAHETEKAMCIKTTSQGLKYKNSPFHSDGWAWFSPGEIVCLSKETALQTENFFEIPHSQIILAHSSGQLSIEPTTDDCKGRILAAVNKSQRLSGKEKARFGIWLS